MTSIEIRPAHQEDTAELANIMAIAWCSAFRGILPDSIIEQYTQFDNCQQMFSHILTSGIGNMYLAILDRQPMGLLYWLPESGNAAKLEALLTIPDAWGRGIGKALIEKALIDSRADGFITLHVWPFVENHRARRFYEKVGFLPTGNEHFSDALETEYVYYL